MKTIIIAGGSGFLGQILESHFTENNYNVKILTRQPKRSNDIFWDAKNVGEWKFELEGITALINLTGKSVDCRYNDTNKKLIHDSRVDSTHILGLAINLCETPPEIWMNASTATIYKSSLTKERSEISEDIGDDFSMNIAKSWEEAFYSIPNPKTRKIVLRTSIVLGKNGGALKPLKLLALFGLGGKHGHGQQKVSWIHEADFARAVAYILDHNTFSGNYNLCVPKPTNNKTLMKSIRKAIGLPFGISQPKWLLTLGAKLIGTETELILKSRNVIPKRLLENNFTFKFTNIQLAIKHLVS